MHVKFILNNVDEMPHAGLSSVAITLEDAMPHAGLSSVAITLDEQPRPDTL